MATLDVFTPTANDQSIAYLSSILGGLSQIPGQPGILATMFSVFNSIILVVGLFVIVYVIIVGLLTTAHEGEFLGKKFHGLWTPVRMVIGIAALVPSASGYSGLQIVIMWVIIQGIGAADTLWGRALAYVQQYGSLTAPADTISNNVNQTLQQLFAGLTCMASTNLGSAGLSSNLTTDWEAKKFTGYSSNASSTIGVMQVCNGTICTINMGNCGSFSYGDPGNSNTATPTDQQKINKAQQAVLVGSAPNIVALPIPGMSMVILKVADDPKTIIQKLFNVASILAYADKQYLNFYADSPDRINNENNLYMTGQTTGKPWGWVNDYCTANGITPCCNPNTTNNPSSTCSQAGGKDPQGTNFPAPSDSSDASPTPSDATQPATTLYTNTLVKSKLLTASAFSSIPNLSDMKGADFYNAILNNLTKSYSTAVQAALPPPSQEIPDSHFEDKRLQGWLFAGSYYYWLSTYSGAKQKSANPTISFTNPDPVKLKDYRNNLVAVQQLFTPQGGNPSTAAYSNISGGLQDQVLKDFMINITGGSTDARANPLIRLQSFGQQLLLTVEVTYPIIMAVNIFLGAMSMIASVQVLGTGAAQGAYPILSAIMAFLNPLFLGLFAIMLSIGGLLAVYIPLLPYIIFTMTALGWFISIIEALVAAPLVAIGILSPSAQHHELLGKAEPALMMIFSIVLKPSLMIFGLIAAMLLGSLGVAIVNATFQQVMQDIVTHQLLAGQEPGPDAKTQGYTDLLELIFFMAAYLFLVLAVLNKAFSLIAILPGKVMTWIGGQAEGADTDAQQEVKGAVGSASSKAAGAAAGSTQTGMSKAKRSATKEKEDFAQAKTDKSTTQTPPKK